MGIIRSLDNFIINRVKEVRINTDTSQNELSKEINDIEDSNFVGSAERNKTPTGYNDHHLNIFANYFTKKVSMMNKEMVEMLGLKEKYEVKDFYPPEPIVETFIEKDIKSFSKDLKPSGAIRILIESEDPYLKVWRSIKEICDFCNTKFEKSWKQADFTRILVFAKESGSLARHSENVAQYKLI